uniref:Uncharacterized protein n=1 Tax=Octopus bimaculoides TaxID=37653 RepID=A0A0L8GVB3_OCTBM
MSGMEETMYAAATSRNLSANAMEMQEIHMDKTKLEKYKKLFKKQCDVLKITPPKEVFQRAERKIITYRTLNVETKKIEVAETDELEQCLNEVKPLTTFYARGSKFGTVEVRFTSEKEAKKHSTVPLRTARWALLPTHCRRRAARVRIGRSPPEIDPV